MDISQEWNKGTNTIGTYYNQPKTKVLYIKRVKITNKTNLTNRELYQETHVNHIKKRRTLWEEHTSYLGSWVWGF